MRSHILGHFPMHLSLMCTCGVEFRGARFISPLLTRASDSITCMGRIKTHTHINNYSLGCDYLFHAYIDWLTCRLMGSNECKWCVSWLTLAGEWIFLEKFNRHGLMWPGSGVALLLKVKSLFGRSLLRHMAINNWPLMFQHVSAVCLETDAS